MSAEISEPKWAVGICARDGSFPDGGAKGFYGLGEALVAFASILRRAEHKGDGDHGALASSFEVMGRIIALPAPDKPFFPPVDYTDSFEINIRGPFTGHQYFIGSVEGTADNEELE